VAYSREKMREYMREYRKNMSDWAKKETSLKQSANERILRQRRKRKGLCATCGRELTDRKYVNCALCRERKRRRRKEKG